MSATEQWTVTDTLLYFVGIPAAVVLVIAVLALAGSGGRSARRYRPGRPFDFTPVWFLSAPENLAGSAAAALRGSGRAAELTGAETETTGTPSQAGTTGGASDRW
ncbi:aa3-type cytochrome oxidase subunit CtaJ [Micromonospora sp. NBC_01699]|uniref:aa3-type cytochrome oxidase subunit CtaJ n=1 Tax=Micromonospora sp. NBC_01699 TaxID=2975984 RepID=UPI003FA56C34